MPAQKWFPQPEIDCPCADISFRWESVKGGTLKVLMHFSRTVDGLSNDLEIDFGTPLAVAWEEESFGLFFETSEVLPKCGRVSFERWTHPALILSDSRWRDSYADRKYVADDRRSAHITHYFLVSMNDLLHVLAETDPKSQWVTPAERVTPA